MTTLKSPNKRQDQIKTRTLIECGKRLAEIRNEIIELTAMIAIHTEYNPFSQSINDLIDDIRTTLGERQLLDYDTKVTDGISKG